MFSVGIDIQDIESFRKRPFEENRKFYERIFTPDEIAYCTAKSGASSHFAARFAAKEAVMKALDPRKITQRSIEVVILPGGKPEAVLHNKNILPDDHEIKISISHSGSQATAVAIVHPK